jgi:hypothetical protein
MKILLPESALFILNAALQQEAVHGWGKMSSSENETGSTRVIILLAKMVKMKGKQNTSN